MLRVLSDYIIANKSPISLISSELKSSIENSIAKNILMFPDIFTDYFSDGTSIIYFIITVKDVNAVILPIDIKASFLYPATILCNSLELVLNLEGKMYSSFKSFILDPSPDDIKGFLLSSMSSYSGPLHINYFKDLYGFEPYLSNPFIYKNLDFNYCSENVLEFSKKFSEDKWAFNSLYLLHRNKMLETEIDPIKKDLNNLFKVFPTKKVHLREVKKPVIVDLKDFYLKSIDSTVSYLDEIGKPIKLLNCTQRMYQYLSKVMKNSNSLVFDPPNSNPVPFFSYIKFLNIEQTTIMQNSFNPFSEFLVSNIEILKKELVIEKKLIRLLNDL